MLLLEINKQVKARLPRRDLEKSLKVARKGLKIKTKQIVSLALVSSVEIKKINKQYRGKNKVTDVLSFNEDGFLNLEKDFLGEIIICFAQANKQAKEKKHSLRKELIILLIHGYLHLLGYDHEKSEKEALKMEALEKKIYVQFEKTI